MRPFLGPKTQPSRKVYSFLFFLSFFFFFYIFQFKSIVVVCEDKYKTSHCPNIGNLINMAFIKVCQYYESGMLNIMRPH